MMKLEDYQWKDGNTRHLLIVKNGDIILASSKNEFNGEKEELFDSERKPDYEALKQCLSSMKALQSESFDEMLALLDESSEGYFYAKKLLEDSE